MGYSQFIRFLDIFKNVLYIKSCLYVSHTFSLLCLRIGSNIRYQNLPSDDCWPGVKHVYTVSQSTSRALIARGQPVYTVSKPTSRGLFGRAAACFPTYLKVTPGDCWPRSQPVYKVSNPTYKGMSVQGAV